jgi:hypothetical protein
MVWVATGVVVLLALVLLFWRPWSSRDESTRPPAGATPPPETAPPAIATPTEPNEARKAAPRSNEPGVPTKEPGAPSTVPGGLTVAAQLCRNFSTSGGNWRCNAVDTAVAPGALVLYTRVKSPRNAAIVHRWYRGNSLRQSVTLSIRANATEGYRTYSRQTVSPGEWRVEVRSTDGHLLHEQQFAVK